MEPSPSWEAASCGATQELPSILWNPKVYFRVHTSPYLEPDQSSPYHPNLSLIRSISTLSIRLRLGLPSGLFPSGFPTNILYSFLFFPFVLHALPISSSSTDHCNYIWRWVQVMKTSVARDVSFWQKGLKTVWFYRPCFFIPLFLKMGA
jgi:hypothetical protein